MVSAHFLDDSTSTNRLVMQDISEQSSLGKRIRKAIRELPRGKYRCIVMESEEDHYDEEGGTSPPPPRYTPPDSQTQLNCSLGIKVQRFFPTITGEHLDVHPE